MKAQEQRAAYTAARSTVSAEWPIVPFEKVATPQSDRGKRIKQRDYLPEGRIPVIDQGQAPIGGYTDDENLAFSGELPVVLFGDHTRAVKLVSHRFAVGADGIKIFRPAEGVRPKYLYYWMKSARIPDRGYGRHYQYLRQLSVPLPPLDKQDEIVAEIEKQFSRLDEAVANLKRVKANLKRYKAAVLKAAVEGHLVETEAERARREGRSYETGAQLLQRILETRRSQWQGKGKYKEPVAPDTTNPPDLPEGWVWASVDQLAAPAPNSITDGPFGSNLKTEHYQEIGPRVIRLQNIKDGEFADEHAHITQEHFDRLSKHQIHAGDLVIASLGENPPRACIIPATVGPAIVKADCIRFKPDPSMHAKYLNAALNCLPTRQRVKDVLHGIGRPRLSLGEIRSIALPVPPEAEQHRIVAEIDRRISLLRVTETQVDANLQRAERLRQSVLGKAYVG